MTIDSRLDTIYALALLPTGHEHFVCLAARASGLYCSEDGGAAWRALYSELQLDIEVPTSALGLVRGSTTTTIFAGAAGTIMRSDDGGKRWQVSMLSTAPIVTAVAASPAIAHGSVVLAATLGDGVLRSADRGATWAPWNFGLLDHQALCLAISPAFASDETVYVGTETGLFRSTNGGRSWRDMLLPYSGPVTSIALLPQGQNPGMLVAGTEGAGLWHSADSGMTWDQSSDAPADDVVLNLFSVARDEIPADMLAVTSSCLLVSCDAGRSWQRHDILPIEAEITCAAALSDGTLAIGDATANVTILKPLEQKAT